MRLEMSGEYRSNKLDLRPTILCSLFVAFMLGGIILGGLSDEKCSEFAGLIGGILLFIPIGFIGLAIVEGPWYWLNHEDLDRWKSIKKEKQYLEEQRDRLCRKFEAAKRTELDDIAFKKKLHKIEFEDL